MTVKTEREKSFDAAKEYNRLLVRSAKYDSQDTDFYGQRTEVVIRTEGTSVVGALPETRLRQEAGVGPESLEGEGGERGEFLG